MARLVRAMTIWEWSADSFNFGRCLKPAYSSIARTAPADTPLARKSRNVAARSRFAKRRPDGSVNSR